MQERDDWVKCSHIMNGLEYMNIYSSKEFFIQQSLITGLLMPNATESLIGTTDDLAKKYFESNWDKGKVTHNKSRVVFLKIH